MSIESEYRKWLYNPEAHMRKASNLHPTMEAALAPFMPKPIGNPMPELINRILGDVRDLPDESSPGDQSPQLRVRVDELRDILERHLTPPRTPTNWSAP
jgi:hypothetical protein